MLSEVIKQVYVDERQRTLYLESLEVLSDEHLDMFHRKLISILDILEERTLVEEGKEKQRKIADIRHREYSDHPETFDILLSNI